MTLTTYRFPDIRGQMAKNRCLRGQKWSTRSPFLTLHLETPKDVATKGEKHSPEHSSYRGL